jgi:anti-sigma B factor antagonist
LIAIRRFPTTDYAGPLAGRPVRDDDALSIEVAPDHSAAVVRLEGEIDISNAAALAAGLRQALSADGSAPELVVDLAQLSFIDARGLAALVEGRRLADLSGTTMVLTHPSGLVRRLLQITGLAAVLPVREEG